MIVVELSGQESGVQLSEKVSQRLPQRFIGVERLRAEIPQIECEIESRVEISARGASSDASCHTACTGVPTFI